MLIIDTTKCKQMKLLHLKKFFWSALEDNILRRGSQPILGLCNLFYRTKKKKIIKTETTPSIGRVLLC